MLEISLRVQEDKTGGCLEQALDRQPARHADPDALPKTSLGLGVEAEFLATLASHPPEAISHEFDAMMPFCAILRSSVSGERLTSFGQSKSTPISVFSLLERGSRLYEPTKPIRRSKSNVLACKSTLPVIRSVRARCPAAVRAARSRSA